MGPTGRSGESHRRRVAPTSLPLVFRATLPTKMGAVLPLLDRFEEALVFLSCLGDVFVMSSAGKHLRTSAFPTGASFRHLHRFPFRTRGPPFSCPSLCCTHQVPISLSSAREARSRHRSRASASTFPHNHPKYSRPRSLAASLAKVAEVAEVAVQSLVLDIPVHPPVSQTTPWHFSILSSMEILVTLGQTTHGVKSHEECFSNT